MGIKIHARSFERKYHSVADHMRAYMEYERISGGADKLFCETTESGITYCVDELSNFGYKYDGQTTTNRRLFNNEDLLEIKFVLSDELMDKPEVRELESEFFNSVYQYDKFANGRKEVPKIPMSLIIALGVAVLGCGFNVGLAVIGIVASAVLFAKRQKLVKPIKEKNDTCNKEMIKCEARQIAILGEARELLK